MHAYLFQRHAILFTNVMDKLIAGRVEEIDSVIEELKNAGKEHACITREQCK